jgi:hypothetical protein
VQRVRSALDLPLYPSQRSLSYNEDQIGVAVEVVIGVGHQKVAMESAVSLQAILKSTG